MAGTNDGTVQVKTVRVRDLHRMLTAVQNLRM